MRSVPQAILLVLLFFTFLPGINAQSQQDKPKIIIGVVVDQMRWDYLYRYQDRYVDGGFKRMLREGFACENTQIPYAQTATGPGHTCVFTGSVPAIHGIVENDWYDRSMNKKINCVGDSLAQKVGVPHSGTSHSPRNLLTTTIGDELKLSNNSRSKVVGVSIKDRAAILPAGHMSNGSYWYDKGTGNFITSTFYTDELPRWVNEFNDRNLSDQYVSQTWETLYPIETYTQSTEDNKSYEKTMIGKDQAVFPYDFSTTNKDYGALRNAVYGNSLVFEMAKAAMEGEELGGGDFSDMLTMSFSATDGMGHKVGPNAIEIEDMYLRLDQGFADFLEYLDDRYGRDGYLFFITADHGASQSPGFLKENKLPTGVYSVGFIDKINEMGKNKYGIDHTIVSMVNAEVYLNWKEIHAAVVSDEHKLMADIIDILRKQEGVVDAWPKRMLASAPWAEIVKSRFVNGYNTLRSGDIAIILRPGWDSSEKGADHGLWYPFDAHIPLVWMGWNIPHGESNRPVAMTDIAPTLAALLKIQMPSGSVGEPILELVDRNR